MKADLRISIKVYRLKNLNRLFPVIDRHRAAEEVDHAHVGEFQPAHFFRPRPVVQDVVLSSMFLSQKTTDDLFQAKAATKAANESDSKLVQRL
jgi:hypothetical protein